MSFRSENEVAQCQVNHSNYSQIEIKGFDENAKLPVCGAVLIVQSIQDPRKRRRSFLTTPENYPIVFDLLKNRFGNDEKFRTTLREQLLLVLTVREEDMIIQKLPDSIVDRIINVNRNTDSWDISVLRRVLRDQLSKLENRKFSPAIYYHDKRLEIAKFPKSQS
uniref:OmpR/PhoB-type domain-containing protein n=1 Tax=Syphacia muris TaxID=451379 RepID=A0A0N5ATW0_9BILA